MRVFALMLTVSNRSQRAHVVGRAGLQKVFVIIPLILLSTRFVNNGWLQLW